MNRSTVVLQVLWISAISTTVVPLAADDQHQSLDRQPFSTPKMTQPRTDVAPFEYIDVGAKIPNYVPSDIWGVQGEPRTTMQKPLSPDESLKHFVTPESFHVELFASEPDIGGKPIAMNWDHSGRLFVCETIDYPNELQPPGKGRDRIRICEDTDNDGRADKFTIFAQDLSIPTSLIPCRGGWIVQNGTETLFLKDVDGDDRADVRHVLIENWNAQDTHGGVSNFRYGPDNWIWAMQGYNPSEPIINGQRHQTFRMGFFRFRLDRGDPPKVVELEFVRSTNNNTWGLGFSEEGLVFGSTANHNPSVFMPIPNRYYEKVRGWTRSLQLGTIADTHRFQPITDKVRQVDHFGGYTAGAGHALYTARRYPADYWNRTAFVSGPTGHLVGTFVLTPIGSDFRATSPCNLLASDDEWTAPIMAEVGPDGNVWVIDWYNYIVQHNPTPRGFTTGKGGAYETDLRDKRHGRIYRVVFGPDTAEPPTSLGTASDNQLVDALKHPNMFWRLQAQRLIVERGHQALLSDLITTATDQGVDAIGLNVGAMHALWTMHGLGLLDGSNATATDTVKRALKHPSPGVRRVAINVLPHHSDSAIALLDANLLSDPDAQVRLATLLRLADLPPTARAGNQIVQAMLLPENATDKWIPDAATCAAANNADTYLAAICTAKNVPVHLLAVTTVVADHYARGPSIHRDTLFGKRLLDAESGLAGAWLRGIERGWPMNRQLPDPSSVDPLVANLLPRLQLADRGVLLQLARRWGCESVDEYIATVRESYLKQLDDPDADAKTRIDAARQFVAIQPSDATAVSDILDRVTPQTPPEIAAALLDALAASDATDLGSRILNNFRRFTPALRAQAISILLARPVSTLALLKGVAEGEVQLSELSLDQRQMLADHPNPLVRTTAQSMLKRGGALPDADRQMVIDQILPVVSKPGDPAAGKAVFKKHCAKCHVHSGEGEAIGPDLTGMAVHTKAELLTQILDPSRSVEGNFQTYSVVTADGRVLAGILTGESQTTIELLDADGKRQTLLREDIEELSRSTKSLMPIGFEKQATPDELRDLLAFLSHRSRYLPIDLSKVATASSVRGMFHSEDATVERLIMDDWAPRTFRGIPFHFVDPSGGRAANVIVLHSPNGARAAKMPKAVSLPCNGPVTAIHLLSGVSGWGYAGGTPSRSASLIVRMHYADGEHEDHTLRNGDHFADYIRRVDVPESEFAFALRDQQMRYLKIVPNRTVPIRQIEFIKGDDATAPIIMAVTVETGPSSETAP